MNKINLHIDFYQQDEASLFIESNALGELKPFGEVLLFSVLSLRQLHNLGRVPAARVLVDTLSHLKAGTADFLKTSSPETPMIVEFRGSPGRKRFIANLEFEADKASFKLHPKGFGILGQGVNYYAPHSVLLLYRYLVEKNIDGEHYLDRIAEAASVCSMVYMQGKVTPTTQTGLAVGIARHAFGYPI